MSTEPAAAGIKTSEDEKILHKLGYAQELFRAMGGFQNFAISLHDHLDPRRMLHLVLHRVRPGRARRRYLGLAARRLDEHASSPWRWRRSPRPIRLPAASTTGRRSSAAPVGAGSRAGSTSSGRSPSLRRSATASPSSRTALFNFWFDYPTEKEYVYLMLRDHAARRAYREPLQDERHGDAEHVSAYWHMIGVGVIVLILLVVPDDHRSLGYVFTETVNETGFGDPTPRLRQHRVLVRVRDRPPDGPVHDHRLRCVGPYGRGDAPGVPDSSSRHVHGRCRVRVLRLRSSSSP